MERVLDDFRKISQYIGEFSNIDREILSLMKGLEYKLKTQQEVLVGRSSVKVNPAVAEIWEQWKLHCIEEGFSYNTYSERAAYELYLSWAGGSVADFTKLLQVAMSRGYSSIREELANEAFNSPKVDRSVTFQQSQYADPLYYSISMLAEPFIVENNVMEMHYFEKASLYSKEKGYTSLDWKATILSWMRKDHQTEDPKTKKNRLVTLTPELYEGHCIGVGEALKKKIAETVKDAAYVERLGNVKARFEKNVLTFLIPDPSYFDVLEERAHEMQQVMLRYSKDVKLVYSSIIQEPAPEKGGISSLANTMAYLKGEERVCPSESPVPMPKDLLPSLKKAPKLPKKDVVISDLGKSLDEKFAHLNDDEL